MGEFDVQVAFVTGAERQNGIGAAVAPRLAQDGTYGVVSDICASPSDLALGGSADWNEPTAVAAAS